MDRWAAVMAELFYGVVAPVLAVVIFDAVRQGRRWRASQRRVALDQARAAAART